jgi:hypothetical protein
MKIPPDAVIPPEKLRDYLLAPRTRDDKSRFLAAGGFSRDQWTLLERAIRDLADAVEAQPARIPSPHGKKWIVDGILAGVSGMDRPVRLVWI